MAKRVSNYSDTFNRADSGDLGVDWDSGYTGRGQFEIVSNDIRSSTGTGLICIETVNAVTLPNNQWAQVEITNFDAAGDFVGVAVRYSAPATDSGYWLLARPGAGVTQLYRVDSGTLNSLGTLANPGWVVGDLVSLEIIDTTLTAFRNGVALALTAADATYASGRAGAVLAAPTGQQVNMQADNFSAGGFKGAGGGGRPGGPPPGIGNLTPRSMRIPRVWRY